MYHRILIPVDGSSTSERALDEAIRMVRLHPAQVELIFVMAGIFYLNDEDLSDYTVLIDSMKRGGEEILEKAKKKLQLAGVVVDTKLIAAKGERIATVIINEAKSYQADLIIIGTHGRSGFSHMLLGSVAEAVVRMSHIPILLIRGH